MSPSWVLVLWAAMACGLLLVAISIPWPTPPSLGDRVLPYLGSPYWRPRVLVSGTTIDPRVPRPQRLARALGSRVGWLTGGDRSAQQRLDVLGAEHSIEQFRAEQLAWGVASAAVVSVLIVIRGLEQSQWVSLLLAVGLAGAAGVMARDRVLTMHVQKRRDRLRSELPTIVEMLAMAVSAGAGLTAALERISAIGSGVLPSELGRVLTDVRVGLPLVPSLQRMAVRNESVELRRFVDAVVTSVERGTPLADVLVAQAGDSRESERRALIESGGRKEIGMMIPVVFLVLPLSVVFVLFPGFYGLQLGS